MRDVHDVFTSRVNEDFSNAVTDAVENYILNGWKPAIDLQQYVGVWTPDIRYELLNTIQKFIALYGNDCSLNWIDTSKIIDMTRLFSICNSFTGDISQWDVSNVNFMDSMFMNSRFNGDISGWDVRNVRSMKRMFAENSSFTGDISRWDVSSVTTMLEMFRDSVFDGDISNWNVTECDQFAGMFMGSGFRGDISGWSRPKDWINCNMTHMFLESKCPREHRPKWAR